MHSIVFLKKFKSEKIYIVDAKKTKMDAIWSKIKCLWKGMFKNESVALFLGQLQVKFPWKEANIAFFRYF